MDLRPQAHDIIRTWLFTTVLRAHLDDDVLPWRSVAISGWVLDPDRKKMSKSKGNVVTPMHLLEEHGADAVRYWAASVRPGTDTAFDTSQMRIGRKLAVKPPNASKFALAELPPAGNSLSHPLDRAAVARLAAVVDEATASFEAYDYARVPQRAEEFFWWFCDYYLELIKGRRYDTDPDVVGSVSLALRLSLSTFQRPFAPFLPFERGGVVVVAAGLRAPGELAQRRRAARLPDLQRPGRQRAARDRRHGRCTARGARGQVPGTGPDARPGAQGSGQRHARSPGSATARPR